MDPGPASPRLAPGFGTSPKQLWEIRSGSLRGPWAGHLLRWVLRALLSHKGWDQELPGPLPPEAFRRELCPSWRARASVAVGPPSPSGQRLQDILGRLMTEL